VVAATVAPESTTLSFAETTTIDNVISAKIQVKIGDRAAEIYTELSSDEGIDQRIESEEYLEVEDSESEELGSKLNEHSDFAGVTDTVAPESANSPSQVAPVANDTRSSRQHEATISKVKEWSSNETDPSALQTERSKEEIVEKTQSGNIDKFDKLHDKKATVNSVLRDFDVVTVANDTQKSKMRESNIWGKMAAPFVPLTLRRRNKHRLVENMKSVLVSTLSDSWVDENSRYIGHMNINAGVLSAFTTMKGKGATRLNEIANINAGVLSAFTTMKVNGASRLNEIALTIIRLSAIVQKRFYYALQTLYRFLFAMSDKNAATLEMLWDLWM